MLQIIIVASLLVKTGFLYVVCVLLQDAIGIQTKNQFGCIEVNDRLSQHLKYVKIDLNPDWRYN